MCTEPWLGLLACTNNSTCKYNSTACWPEMFFHGQTPISLWCVNITLLNIIDFSQFFKDNISDWYNCPIHISFCYWWFDLCYVYYFKIKSLAVLNAIWLIWKLLFIISCRGHCLESQTRVNVLKTWVWFSGRWNSQLFANA